MKIKPSNRFILDKVSEHGEVILLMGTRSEESVARAKSLEKHKISMFTTNTHHYLTLCGHL